MHLFVIFTFVLINSISSSDSLAHNYSQKIDFTFQGLMAPAFTPFMNDVNQTLNLSIIPKYARFLASKNITGVLVGGTTGEGTSLSVDERKKLVEAWSSAVKETKQHLMVQIGGLPLVTVKELAGHAENLHVHSLLCLPDLYFKPTKIEELIEYLENVGKSAPNTPLLYYQSTKAKVNIKTGELLKSVDGRIPTLVGVKLDSSDIKEGIDALSVNESFTVFFGSKMIIPAGCAIGVKSFMSATLNFIPELSFKIFESCNDLVNMKSIQHHQNILQNIEKEILKYGGYVETMKTAMSLITGLTMGPPRAPLKALSEETIQSMKISILNIGLRLNETVSE